MTKREFIEQFILARVPSLPDSLNAVETADKAALVWEEINKICPQEPSNK